MKSLMTTTGESARRYRLRSYARGTRDSQWRFMERIRAVGRLWFTPWNKNGRVQLADEFRDGLITGIDKLNWIRRHRSWFLQGKWSDERDAYPIRLTKKGRWALQHRSRYDMEPVEGGLVEPGWVATPLPRKRRKESPRT